MTTSSIRYPSEELRGFVTAVLGRLGLTPSEAALAADVLHDADLAGVDTHGIANLATHPHYAPGLLDGSVDARAEPLVLRDGPVAAGWDARRGFGPVIAHRAMSAAVAKAEHAGIGMITVRDGRHFGANGYFAELAARRGLVAMVTANTPAAAFPPGGRQRAVGTNPLAFAAPIEGRPPLVVDVAMTTVSGSRVSAARRAGERVPEGWVVDADGQPSTDPMSNRTGGALELLGGDVAGHKGYGLALVVEVLALLGGAEPGVRQLATGWAQGQWFAAWSPDLFGSAADFRIRMRSLLDALHDVPTEPGGAVRVPGERRAACRAERAAHGIPIAGEVEDALRALASRTGVRFPGPLAADGDRGPLGSTPR